MLLASVYTTPAPSCSDFGSARYGTVCATWRQGRHSQIK